MPSLSILIVEDDIASLELMTEVFTSLETEVHPVSDGQRAATLVNRQKFDGVFMDLQMPDMNGFELAHKIRRSSWNKSTPIVVVTGSDDRQTMQQAFATGATFFLQKPVDRQKLTSLFRKVRGTLLEKRRRYTRVPLEIEVHCTVGSRTTRGRTWNLSHGGLQLEANDLKSGDVVRLSFRLPGSVVMIDAAGTVIWTRDNRQGIQFSKMSTENESEIREFIARAETESSSHE